jgi:hypothetical protein
MEKFKKVYDYVKMLFDVVGILLFIALIVLNKVDLSKTGISAQFQPFEIVIPTPFLVTAQPPDNDIYGFVSTVQIPTEEQQYSEPTNNSTITIKYDLLGTLLVPGNSNSGIRITIPESGYYKFSYSGGVYGTYPAENIPYGVKTWLTAVIIFPGGSSLWDGRRLKTENAYKLADHGFFESANQATAEAQGNYVQNYFYAGESVTLICADYFDSYSDNPGEISVDWFKAQ